MAIAACRQDDEHVLRRHAEDRALRGQSRVRQYAASDLAAVLVRTTAVRAFVGVEDVR
jgi:hypothetical protein